MDEENKDQVAAAMAITGLAAFVVGSGLNYLRIKRTERAKRAKIEAYEAEIDACIVNYRTTLITKAQDPTTTWEDLLEAMRYEGQFLHIVKNQLLD